MNQWNRELLELCSKQWENAMETTDNFSAEIRSKEAVDQHSDADVASFNMCMGSSTERVAKAMECIARRGYLGENMEALDIGSGNGVFTLPFAENTNGLSRWIFPPPCRTRFAAEPPVRA